MTRWLNRQLAAMRARLGGDATLVEAPLGVSGYRIDVSTHEEPNPPDWKSLCRAISIDGDGNPAPLQFPPPPAAAVFSTSFNDELTVEPAPARSIHATNQTAWLPQHFTRWQGGSLVANDPTLFELSGTTPRAGATDQTGGPTIAVPPPTYAGAAPLVPLRYGTLYHFRCRLADLTGGGPTADGDPATPALHPVATTRFLRHVQPKTVRTETNIAIAEPGDPTPAVATITTMDVWRPLIGYPELTFAGIDDPAVIDAQIADAAAARTKVAPSASTIPMSPISSCRCRSARRLTIRIRRSTRRLPRALLGEHLFPEFHDTTSSIRRSADAHVPVPWTRPTSSRSIRQPTRPPR